MAAITTACSVRNSQETIESKAYRRILRAACRLGATAGLLGALGLVPATASAELLLQAEIAETFPGYPSGLNVLAFRRVVEDPAGTWDGTHFTAPETGVYRFSLTVWVERVSQLPCLIHVHLWREDTGLPVGDDGVFVVQEHRSRSLAARLHVLRALRLTRGEQVFPTIWSEEGCSTTIAHPPYETWLEVERLDP